MQPLESASITLFTRPIARIAHQIRNFSAVTPYLFPEDGMKVHFTNLSNRTWFLLIVPAIIVAYPVVRVVIPAVIHAIVPQVVQNVLSMI